jgi:hypothetical protein
MPFEPTRSIAVSPARLDTWISGFATRHGEPATHLRSDTVLLTAPDGAVAQIAIPFPPLQTDELEDDELEDGELEDGELEDGELETGEVETDQALLSFLIGHVRKERRVGALLVRKGGFAVGVFEGPRLVQSKVGSSYVQGKTKAGGWSQQRYARRRDNQSKKAYADAADEAVRLLLPHVEGLAALITGGDKPAITAVLNDPRLSDLVPLVLPRVYPVADPRLRVLQAFPDQFLAVQIELNELA